MKKNFIIGFWAIVFSLNLVAQPLKRADLVKKQQSTKEEIKKLNNELGSVRKHKNSSLAELSILQEKIKLREQVVEYNRQQVVSIDGTIGKLENEITRLDSELNTLKTRYAKSVAYAYKNRSNYDFLSFIFSATNVNDALKRIAYLKSFRFYGEQQANAISGASLLLQDKIASLQATRVERKKAFDDEQSELLAYTVERLEKDELINTFKTQEKQLAKEIALKSKADNELQKGMQVAVLSAGAAEEKPVLDGFESYKGQLPWPVEKPIVKIHFGRYSIPNTFIRNYNPGLTLETDAGAPVTAVFEGEIFSVMDIEGNIAVMVSHGSYFTTYSNLTDVEVTKGQKIEKGQVLGKAVANNSGNGEIEFVLLKQSAKQTINIDPEAWLAKK
jgi:murein hydrolase activator